MNKQIRNFEKQSGIDIYGLGKERAKWEVCLEMFTKLIIMECVNIINKECESHPSKGIISNLGGLNQAKELIKEHFGVEE